MGNLLSVGGLEIIVTAWTATFSVSCFCVCHSSSIRFLV